MFEITPEGIKKEDNVDTAEEVVYKTRSARKMDLAIMAALAITVGYFVFEKIWFSDVVRGNNDAIAVLPFTDMSPRRDQEYFVEGLTVELLNISSRSRTRAPARLSKRCYSAGARGERVNSRANLI